MVLNTVDISPFKNKKTSLVLSGGVVKAGAWHLGVAHALEDLGFTFASISNPKPDCDYTISSYVGASAGSLINMYFANGFTPTDVIKSFLRDDHAAVRSFSYRDMLSLKRPIKNGNKNPLYEPFHEFPLGIRHLIKPLVKFSGIFSTEGLRQYLLKDVIKSNNFDDYPDMFIIATQLDHSRKVIFSKYQYPNPRHDTTAEYYTGHDVTDAVAASMSVPPFYAPFPIYNPQTKLTDYYIDGEIRETLSTHAAIDNGSDIVISSWTHTPYHFHDEIGSLVNYGMPAIAVQSIYLLIQKKIVSSRARIATNRDLLDSISSYMKDNKLGEIHRKKILKIVEKKLDYKPNVKLIDIYPDHHDYKTFFSSSFSLKKSVTEHLVQQGYNRTLEVLKDVQE